MSADGNAESGGKAVPCEHSFLVVADAVKFGQAALEVNDDLSDVGKVDERYSISVPAFNKDFPTHEVDGQLYEHAPHAH